MSLAPLFVLHRRMAGLPFGGAYQRKAQGLFSHTRAMIFSWGGCTFLPPPQKLTTCLVVVMFLVYIVRSHVKTAW